MNENALISVPRSGLDSSSEQFDVLSDKTDQNDVFTYQPKDCPNTKVPYLLGVNAGARKAIIFRPRCRMWSCNVCAVTNTWVWSYRANAGAHELYDRGHSMHFATVTSHEKLNARQSWWVLPKAWMKLQARIRRETGGYEYFVVPELHKNGRVHLHMITTAPMEKRWWKDNARECGFGYQDDVGEVRELGGVTRYVLKYLTKAVAVADMPKGTRRVRTSRTWPKTPPMPKPDGWTFETIATNVALNEVAAAYWDTGYSVVMAGSKSSWKYVRNEGIE